MTEPARWSDMAIIGVMVAGLAAAAIFGSRGPLPAPGADPPPRAEAAPPMPRILAGPIPGPQVVAMPRPAAGPIFAPDKTASAPIPAPAEPAIAWETARVSRPVPIPGRQPRP